MKKKIIILIGAAALAFGGWRLYINLLDNHNGEATYYGNVDTRTVTLGFRFLGQIESIAKDEGESVAKGEALVVLNTDNLHHALNEVRANIKAAEAGLAKLKAGFRVEEIEEAKAQMDEARAALDRAKDNYTRQGHLFESKATSEETYVIATATYRQAEAAFEKAKAAYTLKKNGYRREDIEVQEATIASLQARAEQLGVDLRDSIITAPVDGVILTRYKEPGAIANPGENVLEIAKSDEFWVRAYVDEPDLGEVRPGQEMLIYSDSRPEPYSGRVGFISPTAEFTPKNIQTEELRSELVYRFRVIVDNPDASLRQGMPVTLKAHKE
jgi:HlyD family secretion protein